MFFRTEVYNNVDWCCLSNKLFYLFHCFQQILPVQNKKITKIIYGYFPKFYYFMMTSSVTSAFSDRWSSMNLRYDKILASMYDATLKLYQYCLLGIWIGCYYFGVSCGTAVYRTDWSVMLLISITQNIVFFHQLLKSESLSLIKLAP